MLANNDLLRLGSAMSDCSFVDWIQLVVLGGLTGSVIRYCGVLVSRAAIAIVLVLVFAHVTMAQETTPPSLPPAPPEPALLETAATQESGDDVEQRLRWLESHLKTEARQAQWYEAGWSLVYVGGMGYGAYQIATGSTRAAQADGIVGAGKSLLGAAGMALFPTRTARTMSELDRGGPAPGSHARDQRLALAESLLLRNAHEADVRFKWQPHVFSLLLNLLGGGIVVACGDWKRGLQSTAIAIPTGELSIWTLPWKSKKDLREYKREFGGLASDTRSRSRSTTVASAPSVSVGATGLQLAF